MGRPPATIGVEKVWRYMKFSRFAWTLQKKQLWLARADRLGDPWEIPLAGDQLEHIISHAPIDTLPSKKAKRETAMQSLSVYLSTATWL